LSQNHAGPYSIGSPYWPGTSKLIEEIGELGQVLGKLIAVNGDAEHHWSGNLRLKLVDELADVVAAAQFFTAENMTAEEVRFIAERVEHKLATFRKWHAEQFYGTGSAHPEESERAP
jgi:NTP pyrophosphatase (non-canonical NTP hydrolase)